MGGPTPPNHDRLVAHEVLFVLGEADGDDVLLVVDVPVKPDDREVVLKGGGLVVGVLVLLLDVVVLVRVLFRLFSDVPFAESDLHVGDCGIVHTMGGG